MSNVKMTKKDLIEAIKDYPDDAPIVVSVGCEFNGQSFHSNYLPLDPAKPADVVVWAVSSNPAKIILEL